MSFNLLVNLIITKFTDLNSKKEKPKPSEDSTPKKDPEAPIKSTKDLHEELINNIRDSDSSLRIEVSKLSDDVIDEQIEAHKET
jgi:hypothetical protein